MTGPQRSAHEVAYLAGLRHRRGREKVLAAIAAGTVTRHKGDRAVTVGRAHLAAYDAVAHHLVGWGRYSDRLFRGEIAWAAGLWHGDPAACPRETQREVGKLLRDLAAIGALDYEAGRGRPPGTETRGVAGKVAYPVARGGKRTSKPQVSDGKGGAGPHHYGNGGAEGKRTSSPQVSDGKGGAETPKWWGRDPEMVGSHPTLPRSNRGLTSEGEGGAPTGGPGAASGTAGTDDHAAIVERAEALLDRVAASTLDDFDALAADLVALDYWAPSGAEVVDDHNADAVVALIDRYTAALDDEAASTPTKAGSTDAPS